MQVFLQIVASNAVVALVLAAGVALLGRIWRNPACLHLLWMFVLLKLVTPPLVTWHVPLPISGPAMGSATPGARELPAAQAAIETEAGPGGVAEGRSGSLDAAMRGSGHVDATTQGESRQVTAGQALAKGAVPLSSNENWDSRREGFPWLAILGWGWAIGVVVCASDRICRIVRFRRLLHASRAASCDVIGAAGRIAGRLGLRRVPEVRMLPVCMSPLVWSLGGRVRVFLPAALFEQLDATAREAILAHELAHVRRRDHWVRLLETAVTTLFWWHPVVWWAARQLRELEDQCCDAMVVATAPQAVKSYAAALLDTLDFLSERSVAAPLGATAATSSTSMARRITMLKSRTPAMRWTVGRVMLLAAMVAVPMALAFGAKAPESNDGAPSQTKQDSPPPALPTTAKDENAVQRRPINRSTADFPEKVDLSTPESAAAAYHRVIMKRDPKPWLEMSVWAFGPEDIERVKQESERKMGAKDEVALMDKAYRNADIVEVLTYRDGLAEVISKLKFPKGVGRDPYSSRAFVRIDGAWKNMGEDRLPSVEEAEKRFDKIKDNLWKSYVEILEGIKSGKPVMLPGGREKRSAPIAPGEPMGISVEKADLMGRVEWAFMHGGRDITARKSIEWGEIHQEENGKRTIRYKFYATIWDKDVYIMNQVFTFDSKGNILDVRNVEGYPKKKVAKPVDVTTQAGMKELVEDFFTKNFRDITARETIEWGDVKKTADGNSSIRYKYRATIWDKDVMIMNQVFTFNAKGEYVSYKNVEGFPKKQ